MTKYITVTTLVAPALAMQPLVAAAHHEGESAVIGSGIFVAFAVLALVSVGRLVRQRQR